MKTQPSKYSLESYIDRMNSKLPEITVNVLKKASFFQKPNESPGIDDKSAKIIRCCFGELAT